MNDAIQPFKPHLAGCKPVTSPTSDERVAAFMTRLWARVAASDHLQTVATVKPVPQRRKKPIASAPAWYEPIVRPGISKPQPFLPRRATALGRWSSLSHVNTPQGSEVNLKRKRKPHGEPITSWKVNPEWLSSEKVGTDGG